MLGITNSRYLLTFYPVDLKFLSLFSDAKVLGRALGDPGYQPEYSPLAKNLTEQERQGYQTTATKSRNTTINSRLSARIIANNADKEQEGFYLQ